MPKAAGGQERDELSQVLLDLRRAAGLTGARAAEHLGFKQPTISRYERGVSVPHLDDLGKLLDLYRASPATRRRIEQMVRDLREDTQPGARVVMARGAARMQRRVGRIEQQSRVLRYFHPVLVCGLLQLPEYARVIFSSGGDLPDIEESVAARTARQVMLDDGSKRFAFVLPEGVLRWHVGSPQLMVTQIAHLVEVSQRRNVRVGVIPWTTSVTTSVTSGFDIYDERAVSVGTETATAFLTDRHDVEQYVKLFALLEAEATFGDAARRWLEQVAAEYAELTTR